MLEQTVHEHRMEWELWAESAESWPEFRETLSKRGYRNLPMASGVGVRELVPSVRGLPNQKTMMRKS